MQPVVTHLSAICIAAIGGFVVVKFLDRLRKKDAESEAKTILENADRDAQNRLREAELEAKERALAEKTTVEEELAKVRDELRDRERLLDKRQETIEQQADDLRKQERMVEPAQRRLADKTEASNQKAKDLDALT